MCWKWLRPYRPKPKKSRGRTSGSYPLHGVDLNNRQQIKLDVPRRESPRSLYLSEKPSRKELLIDIAILVVLTAMVSVMAVAAALGLKWILKDL